MNRAEFKSIQANAHQKPNSTAALTALLSAYADSGCATYPIDSRLFRAAFDYQNVALGFILREYRAGDMYSHTVERITEPNQQGEQMKHYTIEFGGLEAPQSITIIGHRTALATAKAIAGTGNGVVLLRGADGRARSITPSDCGANPALIAWGGDDESMPMGIWHDNDDDAFSAAIRDELAEAGALPCKITIYAVGYDEMVSREMVTK
jgi:hypothetical protein